MPTQLPVETIEKFAHAVMEAGPRRVVVDDDGLGVTPSRAVQEYGMDPTVIFLRGDGWSLGATPPFETLARQLWEDEWVAVLRRTETDPGNCLRALADGRLRIWCLRRFPEHR